MHWLNSSGARWIGTGVSRTLKKIPRLKHKRVLDGVTTYRPLATFAWRKDVKFTPWPSPDYWHMMQQVGFG